MLFHFVCEFYVLLCYFVSNWYCKFDWLLYKSVSYCYEVIGSVDVLSTLCYAFIVLVFGGYGFNM